VIRKIGSLTLIAFPLTLFSFGFAGNSKTPTLFRYVVAPGYVFYLHFRSSLSMSLVPALLINTLYYTAIIFLISTSIDSFTPVQTALLAESASQKPVWWKILMGLWLIYINISNYINPGPNLAKAANQIEQNGMNAAPLIFISIGCWLVYLGMRPVRRTSS
jgi:hypothetical protein